ncbi:hypothetical protein FSP39_006873 [Pinctada imbricata]|uniref:Peptidase M12B domain-containing protein n=1 Tax=Pinctada imbricata TaxID=66713 RepID=A0AA88YE38_PINIB|nr:hypothetical protein FSP39_006873 [Pinctada imbricata]
MLAYSLTGFWRENGEKAPGAWAMTFCTTHGVVHQVAEDLVMEPVIVKGAHTTDHVIYKRPRVKGNLHGDTLAKRSGSGFRYNSFDPGSMTGGSSSQPGHNFGQFHPGSLDGTGRSNFFFLSDGGIKVVQTPSLVRAEVEVLVWTDLSFMSSFQKLLGNSNVELEILKYISVVVHSGNLLFQHGVSDSSLNISVTLSGVIICKTRNCSRFTYDHEINGGVDNHIALNHFAATLRESFRQNSLTFRYDYAVAFTRLDLTDPHGTPIGVSFTDEICSIQNGKSSSIVEDQGGFSCIGTFVHEMSHTLGCDHDGWFRSRQCSPNDGYIMSAVSPLTKNGFYFSRCSVDSIKQNLIKPNASCVKDNGHSNFLYQALGRSQLPGQIYNRTQQCHQIYGTNFCLSIGTRLEDICYKMYCWDPNLPNVCSTKSAAAPGTSCGSHKWCMNGECVYSSEAP